MGVRQELLVGEKQSDSSLPLKWMEEVQCFGNRPARLWPGNLRIPRERSGRSLSKLARRSNIAKERLSRLESGIGNPTIETVLSPELRDRGSTYPGASTGSWSSRNRGE